MVGGSRLKIVVSPVRVRVSPFTKGLQPVLGDLRHAVAPRWDHRNVLLESGRLKPRDGPALGEFAGADDHAILGGREAPSRARSPHGEGLGGRSGGQADLRAPAPDRAGRMSAARG